MNCNVFANRLDAYIGGELTEPQLREMERHKDECPECRKLADDALALRDMLAQLGNEDAPPELHENMMRAVRQAAPHGRRRCKMNRWGVACIAAAAVLCIAIPVGIGILGGAFGGYASGEAQYYAGNSLMQKSAVDMAPMAMPSAVPSQTQSFSEEMSAYDDAAYDKENAIAYEGERQEVYGAKSAAGGLNADTGASSGAAHGLKLIRSGYVSLESRAFDEDLSALNALVAGYDGYIENSSVSGVPYNVDPDSYGRWANMTVRVPSAALDSFLADAKGVGNLLDSSLYSQDVTASYQDTELRLATLRTQHERLIALLAKAEIVEDLIALESELTRVQYEIDSLTGSLRDWDSRVDYSSISISINEVKVYPLNEKASPLSERLSQGFSKGLHDFSEGAQNLLVSFVTYLPVILLAAALVLVVVAIIVHLTRRNGAKRRGDDRPPKFD